MEIKLRGTAEGVLGKSVVSTTSPESLIANSPELNSIVDKLEISEDCIKGYTACDG